MSPFHTMKSKNSAMENRVAIIQAEARTRKEVDSFPGAMANCKSLISFKTFTTGNENPQRPLTRIRAMTGIQGNEFAVTLGAGDPSEFAVMFIRFRAKCGIEPECNSVA